MHRMLLTFVLLSSVVGFGLLTGQGVPAAQEATLPGEAGPFTIETLASAPATDAPGMLQVLFRVTLAPHTETPVHVHPGQLLVTVESGTLAYTIFGEGQSLRARAGTPTADEVIVPNKEVTLGPGEWFVYEPYVAHMDRNLGNEPTVILISGLVAADEPFLQPVDRSMDMATPAA
jgi:uncharacterized RmlC-like cupin family protein